MVFEEGDLVSCEDFVFEVVSSNVISTKIKDSTGWCDIVLTSELTLVKSAHEVKHDRITTLKHLVVVLQDDIDSVQKKLAKVKLLIKELE